MDDDEHSDIAPEEVMSAMSEDYRRMMEEYDIDEGWLSYEYNGELDWL